MRKDARTQRLTKKQEKSFKTSSASSRHPEYKSHTKQRLGVSTNGSMSEVKIEQTPSFFSFMGTSLAAYANHLAVPAAH